MTTTRTNTSRAVALLALALPIAAMGIYLGEADDAPGAAAMGLLLMIGAVILAVKALRNRLSAWAARTAIVLGVIVATFAAYLTHAVTVAAPLFAQGVPSTIEPAPPSQHVAAVQRARDLVRSAIQEQNLPGVSVAVGVGDAVVWAEGFGWRDEATETPVTPRTRFNIGTAASAVSADTIARLGLANTGAEAATEWSPEHVGEPEEDFPLFTIVRHVIFQPIGLAAPAQPLPGERATFYVPRVDSNPRRGRRLMYMRHLACCAGTLASYSTASDLVRVGLVDGVTVDGELAGGTVASLLSQRDRGIVVTVLSNITHANTSALAAAISEAFAAQTR